MTAMKTWKNSLKTLVNFERSPFIVNVLLSTDEDSLSERTKELVTVIEY